MNLNETDKNRIIELVKAGEKLPKEFNYKLFADEEDVFLFWNGRKEDATNVTLPFHSIEHIDEPRKEEKKQGDMFEIGLTPQTGNYLFENEWQSFRTRKNPALEFTSIACEYKKAGKYNVLVKAVDNPGIDSRKIIEVMIG